MAAREFVRPPSVRPKVSQANSSQDKAKAGNYKRPNALDEAARENPPFYLHGDKGVTLERARSLHQPRPVPAKLPRVLSDRRISPCIKPRKINENKLYMTSDRLPSSPVTPRQASVRTSVPVGVRRKSNIAVKVPPEITSGLAAPNPIPEIKVLSKVPSLKKPAVGAQAKVSEGTTFVAISSTRGVNHDLQPSPRKRKNATSETLVLDGAAFVAISSTRAVNPGFQPSPRKRKNATSETHQTLNKLQHSTAAPLKPVVPNMDISWIPYECSCCFNDVHFEYMVQCYDGHLFCIECLQRYVHEAVYGGGMGSLICLAENCSQSFPESQLQRALPDKLKVRLEQRIQEEEINIANLKNFMRCSFCNCGAVLDDDQQFFTCPNEKCKKVSCKHCHIDYYQHKGLKCKEIEKEQETKVRTQYEEKMAAAKIRECPRCRAKFTKEEGCNKIVCRCGNITCYLCRNTIKGYNHFCQHVHSPGRGCRKCNACTLFTNCEQDDELAIREIKMGARAARLNLGFTDVKEIGAPI